MDLDDSEDNRSGLVIAICPQQQLRGMERVDGIGGRQRDSPQRQRDCLIALFQGEQGCR
jgi:hypothetical protein